MTRCLIPDANVREKENEPFVPIKETCRRMLCNSL